MQVSHDTEDTRTPNCCCCRRACRVKPKTNQHLPVAFVSMRKDKPAPTCCICKHAHIGYISLQYKVSELDYAAVSMRTLDTYRTGQAYYNLLRQLEMAKFTPSSLNPRIVV